MCIIVAKYFPGIGWAAAKNRDRNYTPTLDFIEDTNHGISRIMMHDQVTGYKEGINSYGVSILNTSLDIGDDEPDVEELVLPRLHTLTQHLPAVIFTTLAQ